MKLNLGCGNDILDENEWINVDEHSTDPRVHVINIESLIGYGFLLPAWSGAGPNGKEILTRSKLKDITFVKAHHILEHVENLDGLMKLLHEICVNGAEIDIVVPVANSLWSIANPDHKREFNHKTFLYYTRGFITSDLGLFRGFDLVSQHIEREPDEWFEGISWLVANLHVVLKVVK